MPFKIDLHFFTVLALVFTLTFGAIALVMLNVNDHGENNTACTDQQQCIKVLNGVITTIFFAAFLFSAPFIFPYFFTKNTILVLKIILTVGLMLGSVIAIAMMVDIDQPGNKEIDSQTRAMEAMVYLSGGFGLLTSCMNMLYLGGKLEKMILKK